MSRESTYQGFLKPNSAIILPLYNVEAAVILMYRLDNIDATGEIYAQNLIVKQWAAPQEMMLFDIPTTLYDFSIVNANTVYGVPGYFPSTGAAPVESISGRACAVVNGPLVAGNFAQARFLGKYFVVGNNQQVKDTPVGAPPITVRDNAGSSWSISFWILRQNNSAAANIYAESNAGFTVLTRFIINTNGTITVSNVTSSYTTPIGSAVPLFAWTHCVFTYDGTNIRFYLNGALSAGPTAYTHGVGAVVSDAYINLFSGGQQQTQNVATFQSVLSAGQISRQYLDITAATMGDNGTSITDVYSGGVLHQGGTVGQGWSGYFIWGNNLTPQKTNPGIGFDVFTLPLVGVGWIQNVSSTAEYVYELKLHEREAVD